MNKYTVTFEKAAVKFLRKQNQSTQERLMMAVRQLPNGTDIKKLQDWMLESGMLYQMILNYLTNPRNPSNMVKSYPIKVTRKRSTQIRFAERAAHRLEGGLGTVCGR